jgi:hypothetical protein
MLSEMGMKKNKKIPSKDQLDELVFAMMRDADKNGDNVIDKEEFYLHYKKM